MWLRGDNSGAFGRIKLVSKRVGVLEVFRDHFSSYDTLPVWVGLHFQDTQLPFRLEWVVVGLFLTSFSGLSRTVAGQDLGRAEFLLQLRTFLTRWTQSALCRSRVSFILFSNS